MINKKLFTTITATLFLTSCSAGSFNQSINQSIHQPVNQSVNQPIDQVTQLGSAVISAPPMNFANNGNGGNYAPPPLPVVTHQPSAPSHSADTGGQLSQFNAWKSAFTARLASEGKLDQRARNLLAQIEFRPRVIDIDRKQPEFTKMIWSYLDSAVSKSRIDKGQELAQRYAPYLAQLEKQYGVGRQYILAIWGMESAFGANTGSIDLPSSLATLAYEGRRREFAESQLLAMLELIERGDVRLQQLKGSWAGGMGHTQFIPTTFLKYGVDGNGDGRRDPWNIEDALASTANYLSKSGWQRDYRWGREIKLAPNFDYRYTDNTLTLPQWQQLGARLTSGGNLPSDPLKAKLWLPAGKSGPAVLLYPNFDVIQVYNRSTSYALAVSLLADAISGDRGLAAAWPRHEKPISHNQTKILQQRLTAQGYDTKGTDGILGSNTRRAFRAWQNANGQVPDGFVSQSTAAPLLK